MAQETHDDAKDVRGGPAVSVRRCREPETIARILEREYFDEPIRSFPEGLRRAFAARWCAKRDDVYFVTAEVGGEHAGFVFGHALGDGLVKLFARRNPRHAPLLLWTWLRLRAARGRGVPTSEAASVPADRGRVEAELSALGLHEDARPFEWSSDARAGRIALLSVRPDYRGYGLARRLLDETAAQMSAGGVNVIEAHIDRYNLSSVRAFLKSGYEVRRMAERDFLARKALAG